MRKLKFITLIALAIATIACTNNKTNSESATNIDEKVEPAAGSMVYFQLDSVVKHSDMFNDLSSEFEAKYDKVDKDIQARQKKFQQQATDFQNNIEKGLLTRAEAEEQQRVLTNRQTDLQNFTLQKQQEMAEEQAVILNKVMNAITTFLEKYNEEKKYSAIIANSVIVGDPNLNITEVIIEGINGEYLKNKKNSNSKETKEEETSTKE